MKYRLPGHTFFHAAPFLAKLRLWGMLFLFLAIFAGCTTQTGPPTGFAETTLHSGQAIQSSPIEIDGTYTSAGAGLVWVVLQDALGQYYLQTPPVQFNGDGTWSATNIRPLQGITAVDFVAVTSDGNTVFQNMVDAQEFGAFSTLPDGSATLQSIPITSQAIS